MIRTFLSNLDKRWRQCARIKARFLSKYSDWLKSELNLPEIVLNYVKTIDERNIPGTSGSSIGRPRKTFEEGGTKTKRKCVKSLVEERSVSELAFATRMSLHSSGKRGAAEILKQITETSPKRAIHLKKAYKSPIKSPVKYTAEEALSFYIDNNITKQIYYNMRSGARERYSNIYPSYHVLKEAKLRCYPKKEDIRVTEVSAEVRLQALIDHTVNRIIQVISEEIKNTIGTLRMVFKWGCDGSSGQREYKQKFTEDNEEQSSKSDSNIFVISLVPIQLFYTSENNDKIIIWQNPSPSSPRLCRPIKLLFEKETVGLIKREVDLIERQIRTLTDTKIDNEGQELLIHSELLMTMIDGKICNALTDTSSQKCYICNATPKEMTCIERSNIKSDSSTYRFGLSTLHAWIRFFECLLHIAYRLDIKKWRIQGEEDKASVNRRKKEIQQKFKSQLGLIVDQPKPGGIGNSNDGNTAREFFQNPDISASITGIHVQLIKRFGTILRVISSGFKVNYETFKQYSLDTVKVYEEHYSWFFMPPTLHKILIHGAEIIQHALLPIGQLSEEAQEASHKHFRKYREHHARKCSRKSNIQDVLHRLLLSSDPVISQISFGKMKKKKSKSITPEILNLLDEPRLFTSTSEPVQYRDEEESSTDESTCSMESSSTELMETSDET